MKKGELTCSLAMAKLLAGVPEDAEIGSAAIFVGIKGGGVFMGSHIDPNPEEMASMLSAFSEAKQPVIEGIIREHGMEMLVTVMFYLASSQPNAKEMDKDPADLFRQYFVPSHEKDD